MKATQINPTNVSISLIYCVFGILSFLVLKIVSRYFQYHLKRDIEVQKGKITEEDIRRVNFTKIFLKSYFMKSTLIGSMINGDKKYLLRELFVLSCIGVSCFHINSYILWPSAVGIGVFVATFTISQLLIPLMDEKSRKVVVDESQSSSIKDKPSVIDSNSIQIEHTDLQFPASVQRGVILSKNETKRQNRDLSKNDKAQLIFILIMTVITQILFCQSILTLSFSVSNSGILNLLSFGLSVAIDQLAARIFIGLVGYLIFFVLFRTQMVNFFQNHIFVTFCFEYLAQEIKAVHSQRIIQEMKHKIFSINNPAIHFSESVHERINNNHDESNFHQNATVMKIIPQFFEQASQEICSEIHVAISQILPIGGLLEEEPQIQIQEEKESQTIQEVQEQEQSAQQQEVQEVEQSQQVDETIFCPQIQQAQLIPEVPIKNEETQIDTKSETNYFELFQHDISMFDDTKAYYEVKLAPIKIIKKKLPKPLPKFKKDHLLYFPYEEHKLSHKISAQPQLKENSQNQTIFFRDISTIDQNFIGTISIADCTEISVVKEETEISFVLQQKNINMKNLAINSKPMAISTQRPAKKKGNDRDKDLQSMRKISPYFVTLSSEIFNPKKTKKIQVSKNNKENGNKTNKSFMTSEAINSSRTTKKETLAFTTINNNFSTINS